MDHKWKTFAQEYQSSELIQIILSKASFPGTVIYYFSKTRTTTATTSCILWVLVSRSFREKDLRRTEPVTLQDSWQRTISSTNDFRCYFKWATMLLMSISTQSCFFFFFCWRHSSLKQNRFFFFRCCCFIRFFSSFICSDGKLKC